MNEQCTMCMSPLDSAGKCMNMQCPTRQKERPVFTESKCMWKSVDEPPFLDGEYIVVTNYDDVFMLDFIGGKWKTAGVRFNRGEKPAFWIHVPSKEQP